MLAQAAASAAHHGANPLFVAVIAVLVVIGVAVSIVRLRRGGPGPAVNWIPRSLRPNLNRYYARRGWQTPFDQDGNRDPDRTQV
jgi:hypothetical protein